MREIDDSTGNLLVSEEEVVIEEFRVLVAILLFRRSEVLREECAILSFRTTLPNLRGDAAI